MGRSEKGFTLIELLIVLAIIAIIAALAIPNLLAAIQRAKQRRGMAEIRGLGTACASYATDTNNFPLAAVAWADTTTVADMDQLAPYYLRKIPNPDPWLTNYQYASTSLGTDFGIRSLGKDKTDDGMGDLTADLANNSILQTHCFENDIIWLNQNFAAYPENRQKGCQ